jgi:predicted membrane channel-forming protein YqfA (hemolysin III family)
VCRAHHAIQRKVQTVTVKSTVGIVVLVFIVFYAMTSPDQAANLFHNAWHVVVNVAHGVGNFFNKLAS